MRHIPRFFFSDEIRPNIFITLSAEQIHHACKVLRLKKGDEIHIFNSQNGEWRCFISNIKNNEICVKELMKFPINELGPSIACALINPNKFFFMLEKITELGVMNIIPLITDFTQYRHFNLKKAEQIIIQACEQSRRLSIPKLHKILSLKEFIDNFDNNRLLVGLERDSSYKLENYLDFKCTFLIGPEGGFSEKEISMFKAYNCISTFHFGHNILRSETAAIAFVSSWFFKYS